MILKGYLFSILYALVCLAFAFALYKVGVPKKITRKIVHILVGFEWVILYHFMYPTAHFLAVCVLFLFVLLVAYRKKLMPMIASDGENAPGTVYYGLAMSIMGVLLAIDPKMVFPFGIGVFCTSFGDGFAGLVGQSVNAGWNNKVYKNKSLVGALTCLLVCLGVAFFFSHYFGLNLLIWQCIAIAVFACELELFTGFGLDNITITLGSSLLSYCFIYYPTTVNYIIPILLTPLIIAFAISKKALTLDGIIAAVIIDFVISLTLGNFGFVILCSFFVGGIAVDKIKKKVKKTRQNIESLEEKGDCRDWAQVVVNSIVATIFATLYAVTMNKIFVVAFVASLAEALADTVASGIGVLSGKAFDIFRMKPCQSGLSGGMSALGTFSSLVGAIVISFIAFAFNAVTIIDVVIIIIAAFLGGVFDSFLGSLLQVKYVCQRCGQITERAEHCNEATVKYSGVIFINNDVVNLLATLFAAFVAIAIKIFM